MCRHLLHGSVHEGNECVEEQNVRQHNVGEEEDIEDPRVAVLFSELQLPHAYGELEQLQSSAEEEAQGAC